MARTSIGSLTGAFTGEITFDWFPEPIVVADEIRAVANILENFVPPLEVARQLSAANIAEHFETKTDPDGAPWPEWSGSYAASGRGNDLMVQSGELMETASSEGAFNVNAGVGYGQLAYTGAGVPEYGFYHQFGAPERRNRYGAESPLPQRAFMGIDSETQLAIVAEFDAWLGAVVGGFGGGTGIIQPTLSHVDVFTHPGGRQQFRIGGRWGPNV